MNCFFKKYSIFIFVACLLVISLLYNYQHIIRLKPSSIHQWRQADCWSFALNYYHENLSLLKPSLHYIGKSETGNASGEFPIIYYTVAKIWKITGVKAYIFRGINILIVFLGLLALFKLAEKLIGDTLWALMISLLLFTSPILVFYTNNFIADAPALGLSLIGAWFFYWFYYSQKLKFLIISCVFFTIGALLKVTAAMLFLSIVVIYLVEVFKLYKFKENNKLFYKPLKHGAVLLTVVLINALWYLYSAHYNNSYNGEYFLLGIWPIWRMDYPLINQIARILNENLVYQFFNISVVLMAMAMLTWLIVFFKKASTILISFCLLLFGGGVAYLILWYRVFDVHDYYLLNLLIIVVAIFIAFFNYLQQNHPRILKSIGLKIVFFMFLCYNIYYAKVKTDIKYDRRIENHEYSFLNRSNELEYWRWYHWYSETYLKGYETLEPYLRSLGIERTDRVISINDHSPNISLSLMDQKGISDFGASITDSNRIYTEIKRGAKYLIINNPDYYQKDFIQPFIKHKLGSYMNIDIFDLRKPS